MIHYLDIEANAKGVLAMPNVPPEIREEMQVIHSTFLP